MQWSRVGAKQKPAVFFERSDALLRSSDRGRRKGGSSGANRSLRQSINTPLLCPSCLLHSCLYQCRSVCSLYTFPSIARVFQRKRVMTGVYNPLVDESQPGTMFNNAATGEQNILKAKQRIGRVALIQMALAGATAFVGGLLFFLIHNSSRRQYHSLFYRFVFPDALLAGILGLICGILGFRVSVQHKHRCIFMAYFVLTIVTAVFIGVGILLSVGHMMVGQSRSYGSDHFRQLIVNGIRLLVDIAHFVVCVVSSAMVCSVWNRMGGCCGSGSEPPIVYIHSKGPEPPEVNGNARVILADP